MGSAGRIDHRVSWPTQWMLLHSKSYANSVGLCAVKADGVLQLRPEEATGVEPSLCQGSTAENFAVEPAKLIWAL
jgi:hypothetical protein